MSHDIQGYRKTLSLESNLCTCHTSRQHSKTSGKEMLEFLKKTLNQPLLLQRTKGSVSRELIKIEITKSYQTENVNKDIYKLCQKKKKT